MLSYGRDYDTNMSFFENYNTFQRDTPFPDLMTYGDIENASYANVVIAAKSAYLSHIIVNACENVLYSISVKDNCTDIINSMMVRDGCSLVYTSIGVINSFQIFFSKHIVNSSDILLSTNLV